LLKWVLRVDDASPHGIYVALGNFIPGGPITGKSAK